MKTDPNAHLLAQWIEALENGDLTPEDINALPEDIARLVELAAELRSLPAPRPMQEFRQAARARLMRRIAHSAPPRPKFFVPHRPPLKTTLYRSAARVFGVIAMLLAFFVTGTVYASTRALPGDLVYPVKGWAEAARLRFSPDDRKRELRLEFARERTEEIRALIERQRYSDLLDAYGEVEKRVETFALEPDAGDPIRTLQAELSKQNEVLSSLLESVPDDARPALEQAMDANNRSQERLKDLEAEPAPAGPPGQADKERPPAAPPLPSQAGPKTNSSVVETTVMATFTVPTETDEPEAESETQTFVPPGQADKEKGQTKPNPPRGPNASNGRGQKGKPNGPPGAGPPFQRTPTPADP